MSQTPSRLAAQRSYNPMATSAPAIAVKQPNAPAAQIDTPIEYKSIMVERPQTMQAPDLSAIRRTSPHPRTPALSARHISPDTPPTRDSTMTIQIGISINVCCSLVITFPKMQKPGAMAGFGVVCVTLATSAPIEDGYFLQVDSGGSNTTLLPPGECLRLIWRMSMNIPHSA